MTPPPIPLASAALRRVRETLVASPNVEAVWDALGPDDWPALFRLLDLGADLPRLGSNATLATWDKALWPALAEVRGDLVAVQEVVDQPIVPPGAVEIQSLQADDPEAAAELHDAHCVHVEGWLEAEDQQRLEAAIEALAATKAGTWGELQRDESPALWAVFEGALGSERFRRLTGFELERDEFTLTLSLQSLDAAGIGWHKDLYWPREWVGEDVFAVLYGLSDDTAERGGAFLHYVPWRNAVYSFYRRRHQATVMWNSAEPDGRLLHAVSGYHGTLTERHLVILQCHRRRR